MKSSEYLSFVEKAENGANFIPLLHSWPADLETPLTTWLKVSCDKSDKRPGVLLESVEGGEKLGRWSVIASDPLWVAVARGDSLKRTWRDGKVDHFSGNPFEGIRKWLRIYKTDSLPGIPPLGQLYGMWGFELIQWIESTVPVHHRKDSDPPDGIWMLMDKILIFDQVKRVINAVSYGDLTSGKSPQEAFKHASLSINKLKKLMAVPLKPIEPLDWQPISNKLPNITSNFIKSDFESAIEKTKEHIAGGDVFQLVLSQRIETCVDQKPFDLYRSLRMINPSPYMAFFDFGDWYLIGSSPEVMVKAENNQKGVVASLRPIAGTRPRGSNEDEDNSLARELLSDPKELAEHVMLVDLGRNDLGRVCKPGSVEVDELMVIEKYSHVMHIVSEVHGLLLEEMDVWDLLMATFPAGTVSGAPKIRAMQLINELESEPRGPYSGVYGSVDLGGALNTAITIRTMLVYPTSDGGSRVEVQAGAGIVADSVPLSEYEETLNKSRGMLTAIACLETSDS